MSVVRKQHGIREEHCSIVETKEEAEVIVRLLDRSIEDQPNSAIAAPEINIMKQVAVIRGEGAPLDLINPVIVSAETYVVSFNEDCYSYSDIYNCVRAKHIVVENGIAGSRVRLELKGAKALMVQHLVDHFLGIPFHCRRINLAVVRDGGHLKDDDPCPCGSKKRFEQCCKI